ncbi:MAG: helix-turn-helix domain-containing protein [Hyphomicrobiales bacterium]
MNEILNLVGPWKNDNLITGKQIRLLREAIGWSRYKLALEAGVSWRTIKRIEDEDRVPNTCELKLSVIMAVLKWGVLEEI